MEDITKILYDACAQLGVNLDSTKIQQLLQYKDLLIEWNTKLNLTAITNEDEIMTKHFADSFAAIPYLEDGKKLVDVGTGAGFPGLPLKIANPTLEVTLLDSLNKRLTFINTVIQMLDITGINTIHARAEESSKLRESFHYATARAVSRLNVLAEYCLPLVEVGGVFVAYKGADYKTELGEAKTAISTLGAEVCDIKQISFADINHTLIMLKKVQQTPQKFPRNPKQIAKSPLL